METKQQLFAKLLNTSVISKINKRKYIIRSYDLAKNHLILNDSNNNPSISTSIQKLINDFSYDYSNISEDKYKITLDLLSHYSFNTENNTNTAQDLLKTAQETLSERGTNYDKSKERSMSAIVEAFNIITGQDLTVKQGYDFMMILKLVRSNQGKDKADNYIDLLGYASLAGEHFHEIH